MAGFLDFRTLIGLEVGMGAHRATGVTGFSPLDVVDEVFAVLTREPAPLELPTAGLSVPVARLRLDQVRAWLVEEAPICAERDAVWRVLVDKARSGGPGWVVGAAGVVLPRLRVIADRLADGCAGDVVEVEAAVLSGFVAALRHVDARQPHVERGLLWSAHRAGAWRVLRPCVTGGREVGGSADAARSERFGTRFRVVVPDLVAVSQMLG